jgi:predicted pyridoxine 5'-phosphate oxidase superfamily flavin-nucleotide-binding protein
MRVRQLLTSSPASAGRPQAGVKISVFVCGILFFGGNIMVSIPKSVQDFLPGKLAWVATASREGVPNVTPKGTLKLLDEQHVVFADLFSMKTKSNLEENKKIAVTVADPATAQGYELKQLKKAPRAMPPLHYVVKITVEAIFDQSVGPNAGKQIA